MPTNLALVPVSAAADQAKHKAVIELAAKIRDWQTLVLAVDDMIADQRDFVRWWGKHVSPGRQATLKQYAEYADLHTRISMEDAEQLTGIKQWQESRWRTALKKETAYRDALIYAAQRKAGLRDKDPMAALGQLDRDGPDFWPTPDSLIQAARTQVVPFLPPFPIWECASGDGRLGRGIGAAVMTDKYPQDGTPPLDFKVDNPPANDLIAFTNQPFNSGDDFLKRGLELLDAGAIRGLVLLLRHDHFMAGSKVAALNRAVFEVH